MGTKLRWALLGVLVAALVGLFVARGRGGSLPSYRTTTPTVVAGRAPGDRFEIVVRPEEVTKTKIAAYAFVLQGGEWSPLDAKVTVTDEIRFEGAVRALDGANEVRIVIGELDAITRFDDALSRARDDISDAQVRVLVVPVERR